MEPLHRMCFLFCQISGKSQVKKRSVALALCASLVCSPVYAKAFVGVLWPMFGPITCPWTG